MTCLPERGASIGKLVMTIDGRRLVFAAPMTADQDPMEMTLGQWMAAPALSAAVLCADFFERASTTPEGR